MSVVLLVIGTKNVERAKMTLQVWTGDFILADGEVEVAAPVVADVEEGKKMSSNLIESFGGNWRFNGI